MKITILTLFPGMFSGAFDQSIIGRARDKGLVEIELVNIRDFATDAYRTVDGRPYGGGHGMILRVDVLDRALERRSGHTVLLDPAGTPFTQTKAREFAAIPNLILICGHYEGVDARVTKIADESVSVGPYVLTGGEIPAMVITDSVVRLLPGVLKPQATSDESFSGPVLEYPQYTAPQSYKHMDVPPVLLGGNHADIREWKTTQARLRSKRIGLSAGDDGTGNGRSRNRIRKR